MCDAVRNEDGIPYLAKIRRAVDMPLSADVHFNYRIAIMAIEAGIDKVRINQEHRRRLEGARVVRAAKDHGVPIRIGVNGGSLDKRSIGCDPGKPRGVGDGPRAHTRG